MRPSQQALPLARWTEQTGPHAAGEFLREGRAHERGGCTLEALQCYTAAVQVSEQASQGGILAESLRRSGVMHHQRGAPVLARELCEQSHRVAIDLGDPILAAEALNALAGFDFESGSMDAAREKFSRALELGAASP